jgi:competence protein ComEC
VLLLGVGWACGAKAGRLLAWAAMGALLVWSRPDLVDDCLDSLDLSRPVMLVGNQDSDWKPMESGWESALRVRRARQGAVVVRCSATVRLSFGGDLSPVDAVSLRIKGFLKRTELLNNRADRFSQVSNRRGRWRMHLKSLRFWAPSASDREPFLGGSELGQQSRFTYLSRRLRAWVDRGFAQVVARPGVKAARALVLGERGALDADFRRSLRRFGLSHLFAVSGLHVALLGLLVHWLLRGLRHRARVVLTMLAVIAYLILVGARPSIVRATGMSLLAFGAMWSQRPAHSRQALCLAAGALIIVDPELVLNLGYQLTVSATAGILWLSPVLEERWSPLPRLLRRSLAATVGAQLASLPWTASTFSMIHPMAPLLNLVAIPWMGVFALCSFLGSALVKVVPESHRWVAALLDLGVEPVSWLSSLPPSPWLILPVAIDFLEGCLLAVSLSAILLLRSNPSRLVATSLAVLLLRGPSISDVSEFVALDVGQGDAILLHDGDSAVLVDGGGWRRGDIAATVLIPALARLGIRRLSAAVVTHPDVDHCRGLVDLSYYLPVDRFWISPETARSPCVRDLVASTRIRLRTLWRGEFLQVGRISLEVLHPAPGSSARGNDSSLVIRAALGSRAVLLTGDVEARSEQEILEHHRPEGLRSHILKLPHHGSRTSTTDPFLAAVAPRIAIASVGRRNRYNHPAAEVLDRCHRRRIPVARTDRDGMIRLPLEPHRASISSGRRILRTLQFKSPS